jgi:hypothetical protein
MPRQNDRETRSNAGSTQLLHFFGDFGLDLCGDFITVKDGGSHSIHGNNYLNYKKCKGTPGQARCNVPVEPSSF